MAKATIKTIAEEAGVSIATVSKALNDMPDISEKVKIKIRAIAKRQGYVLNTAARQLASGQSSAIGVIVPNIAEYTTALIYGIVINHFQKAGYAIYLGNSEDDLKIEAEIVADMVGRGVGALLVMPSTTDIRHIEEAVKGSMPIVYMGGAVNPNVEYGISCNSYKSGILAANALYQSGCRNCAVFTWGGAATPQHERTRGFIGFMQEKGVMVKVYQSSSGLTENAGIELARKMLTEGLASGIFCTDDLLACGAIYELVGKGVSIPEQVQIIGCGNRPFAGLKMIGLTTMELPVNEISTYASSVVLALLQGQKVAVQKIALDAKVVLRNTTK